MPRLEANIQWMFNEYDLLDRYDAAARAGFPGVEIQAPYPVTVEQIVERLERNNLKHAIINSPMADTITLRTFPEMASAKKLPGRRSR